jgi:tyrocidine synthetase-3
MDTTMETKLDMKKSPDDLNLLLFNPRFTKQKEYWKNRLAGDIASTSVPDCVTGPPSAEEGGAGAIPFTITGPLYDAVVKLGNNSELAVYIIILTALKSLLYRYTGNHDISVISPVYKMMENQDTINDAVFIRDQAPAGISFKDFLRQVSQSTLNAYENQDYPFEKLLEFMFTDDVDLVDNERISTIRLSLRNIHDKTPGHSLNLKLDIEMTWEKQCLEGRIHYNARCYDEAFTRQMAAHLVNLLTSAMADIQCPVPELSYISEVEKKRLLDDFNATAAPYPRDARVHQLFSRQAKETPDAAAVSDPGGRREKWLSYRELDRRTSLLAAKLREMGVTSDTLVAVIIERSLDMITALLSVLKAGGAYLPIDPDEPAMRKQFLLRDSAAPVVLLRQSGEALFKDEVAGPGLNVLAVDDERRYKGTPTERQDTGSPGGAAYVIYTSGTTGKPKGVIVEHRNVVNVVSWFARSYDVGVGAHVLQMSSYTFDASVNQVFGSLLHGAALYLMTREYLQDIEALRQYIESRDIHIVNFVPTFFHELLAYGARLESLRSVISGSEALSGKTRDILLQKGYRLYNQYGPTETTIDALAATCSDAGTALGKPIANVTCYVVDKQLRLLPAGIAGELVVAGAGVARGYLNRPELNVEKFTAMDAVGNRSPLHVYRTGDLCRWLPDGAVEFLGRFDHQVKIRGYRIELQEIQRVISGLEGVREAVVVAREHETGNKYLCAYIVPTVPFSFDKTALKQKLARRLPAYMAPQYLVQLDKIPLTPIGKIDRARLPEPEEAGSSQYTAPRNRVERTLVNICSGVLNIGPDRIGIDESFFDIGGHSLNAINLNTRIKKELNVNIGLLEVFELQTVRKIAQFIRKADFQRCESIEPVEQRDYYLLSSAQKRHYVLQRLEPDSVSYNMPFGVVLKAGADMSKLEDGFRYLIRRHESLRTSFSLVDGRPVQRVHDAAGVEFHLETLTGKPADFIAPFDLSKAPLLRAAVKHDGKMDSRYLLVIDMHHIVSDGISMSLLVRDFMLWMEDKDLPPLRVQYKDFARWQSLQSQQQAVKQQEAFWLDQYSTPAVPLNLPLDFPRPPVRSVEGGRIQFEIQRREADLLKQLARTGDATMYMTLLAIYYIFLSKLTGQQDIVVGTAVAGRRHADLEPVIGMFVNTLALRIRIHPHNTFDRWLHRVREYVLDAFENQEYQFEELVENISVQRDTGKNPVFDVLFNLAGAMGSAAGGPENRQTHQSPLFDIDQAISKFDLALNVVQTGERLMMGFEYASRLFTRKTMQRFTVFIKRLVTQVVNNPGQPISQLRLISREEKHRVLEEFNNTSAGYPSGKTIHRLFEELARKYPDTAAVVEHGPHGAVLTYNELNRRSGRLAALLREKQPGAGSITGLLVERSIAMVIGILGILKSGGAYLPVDPRYPKSRIDYMLDDGSVSLVLTHRGLDERLDAGRQWLDLDHLPELLSHEEAGGTPPEHGNSAGHAAYIMYTSGSTGKPKGVMVSHRNVVRLVKNTDFVPLSLQTRILQTGAVVFDATTFELWGSLLNGGQLVLADDGVILEAPELKRALTRYHINTMWLTSPLFNELSRQDNLLFVSLEYLLVGGDVLSPKYISDVRKTNERLTVINGYGPTENTTFSLCHSIHRDYETGVPIGKPIRNSTAFILDPHGHLQPPGIPGELYVGGDGVALGYMNNPELTAERFMIKNIAGSGLRLYKTGDRARRLADGAVEFLGRFDHQVKIRGFRVELAEIEQQLLRLEHIKEAVVIDKDQNGDKYLCAYVTPGNGALPREIAEELAENLPDYMIPAYITRLEEMPLTANGKIDRRALPEPQTGIGAPAGELTTSTQKQLAMLWAEVLGIDVRSIGADSDFFQLGGHSLKAVNLVSKIHKVMDTRVPLMDVFRLTRLEELARWIDEALQDRFIAIPAVEKREYYPLSSAQKRLYIVHRLTPGSTNYNIPFIRRFQGKADPAKLEETLQKLIARHESLRTSFETIDGYPVQRIHDFAPIEISIDSSGSPGFVRHFVRPFDLSTPPLLRVGIQELPGDGYKMMVDIHHIIADGISMDVMLDDFISLFQGLEIPGLDIQYKDYAVWQHDPHHRSNIKKQEEYWLKQFEDTIPVLELPVDFPRPPVFSTRGDETYFYVDKAGVDALYQLAQSNNATLHMTLLTVFYVLLSRYGNQYDLVIGTYTSGRRHADLEKIIGMFLNTLAQRNRPGPDKTFEGFLGEVRENTLQAFENQDYPFEILVDKLVKVRSKNRNPVFDVMFGLHNLSDGAGVREVTKEELELNLEFKEKISHFDLVLTAEEGDQLLRLKYEYCTDLFKKETIDHMARGFKHIVNEVTANPGIRLGDIQFESFFKLVKKADLGQLDFNL